MNLRTLSIIAGVSYIIIFFSAIYANFFVLEALIEAPLDTVQENSKHIRFGVLAFLIAAVFDVVVGWALLEIYKEHPLSKLSTFFRMIHAVLMAIALFALLQTLPMTNSQSILDQVAIFNNIWLIGLFFFGIHLILLFSILRKPKMIALFLLLAGMMYIIDTTAHFLLPNYEDYGTIFLAMVAVPSVIGEMSLAIWLLVKGGKNEINTNFE